MWKWKSCLPANNAWLVLLCLTFGAPAALAADPNGVFTVSLACTGSGARTRCDAAPSVVSDWHDNWKTVGAARVTTVHDAMVQVLVEFISQKVPYLTLIGESASSANGGCYKLQINLSDVGSSSNSSFGLDAALSACGLKPKPITGWPNSLDLGDSGSAADHFPMALWKTLRDYFSAHSTEGKALIDELYGAIPLGEQAILYNKPDPSKPPDDPYSYALKLAVREPPKLAFSQFKLEFVTMHGEVKIPRTLWIKGGGCTRSNDAVLAYPYAILGGHTGDPDWQALKPIVPELLLKPSNTYFFAQEPERPGCSGVEASH